MTESKKNKKRAGFTVIELAIVVAVLGILVGLLAPYVSDALFRARTTGIDANLKTLTDCETRLQILNAKNGIDE